MKAGAFDFEKRPRRQLFETIEKAMDRGASAQRDRAVGQSSLFGLLEDAGTPGRRPRRSRTSTRRSRSGPRRSGWPSRRRPSASTSPATRCTSTRRSCSATRGRAASVQRARRDEKVTVAGIVAAAARAAHQDRQAHGLGDARGPVAARWSWSASPARRRGRSVMGKDGKWAKAGPKPGLRALGAAAQERRPDPGDRHGADQQPRRGEPHRRAHRRGDPVA